MKRFAYASGFALMGVAVCWLVMYVVQALDATPNIPAFAGEEDFDTRFWYFVFVDCVGFLGIGAWIGWEFSASRLDALAMWCGVIAGSIVTFCVAYGASRLLGAPGSAKSANAAMLLLFVSWLVISALGAQAARVILRSRVK